MKKWLLSLFVTPKRVRSIVVIAVSCLIYKAVDSGVWDSVLSVSRWMRRLADFIEDWNGSNLPADRDRLLADLVAGAITDEAVDRLLERVAAFRAEQLALQDREKPQDVIDV